MSFAPLAAKDRRGEGVICRVTVTKQLRSQMRSDCYPILLNMQSHILLNMQSHSREATGTPRLINMQSRSREATVAHSQSRRDCYPILLNMHSHSREATDTSRLINMQSRSRKATVAHSSHFVKYAEPQS